MNWSSGADAKLEAAIDRDDVPALRSALQTGANVNAQGRAGVTPLEYAVGHGKKQTYLEPIRSHANPNQRDVEKDNAVTLAADAFPKDREYLTAALQAGGDPHTVRSHGDTILGAFEGRQDLDGMRLLAKAGANLNVKSAAMATHCC